jgi:hypothetical protein
VFFFKKKKTKTKRPVFWNIALVMAVLGVFFIFKTKAETYLFDADTHKFTWQRRSLFALDRREFWLHDIQVCCFFSFWNRSIEYLGCDFGSQNL